MARIHRKNIIYETDGFWDFSQKKYKYKINKTSIYKHNRKQIACSSKNPQEKTLDENYLKEWKMIKNWGLIL